MEKNLTDKNDMINDILNAILNSFSPDEDNINIIKPETNKIVSNDKPDSNLINIDKLFWINRYPESNKTKNRDIVVFNIIAPFVDKTTFKAIIRNIDKHDWIIINYNNIQNITGKVTNKCNFKIPSKMIEYRFNFENYKVDKKKIKIAFNNGIIQVMVPCSLYDSTSDDYVIGLE